MTTAATARDWAGAVLRREKSAEESLVRLWPHLERLDAKVQAFSFLDLESALEQARAVDHKVAHGQFAGPLAGVPIAIKENICVRGWPTRASSRILANYRAPYDATSIERLKNAGAILVGHTNMDEFCMGSSTENSAYTTTKNPWILDRVPGGSSGGSAAALAAELVPLALGSDTGGSVRQPAAFCGVVGLRPTYGRISRYGLIAFASSLDQIGPMAKNIEDTRYLYQVIAGADDRDSTTSKNKVDCDSHEIEGLERGLRIGVLSVSKDDGISLEIIDALAQGAGSLCSAGAQRIDITFEHGDKALDVYHVLVNAEASSNLARYDGMRYGWRSQTHDLDETYIQSRTREFGSEVKRRILLGTLARCDDIRQKTIQESLFRRSLIKQEFDVLFERVDALLAPVTPTTAFPLGQNHHDPEAMRRSDIFTIPSSLANLPALSLPYSLDSMGLPIGLQLIGPAFSETLLFRIGRFLVERSPFKGKRAPIVHSKPVP